MFQKIADEGHFKKIQQGDWIIHYPLTGKQADEIDLSDERFFMLYEVSGIDPANEIILLKNLESSDQPENNIHDPDTPSDDGITLVEKHKLQLISDATWWHRP